MPDGELDPSPAPSRAPRRLLHLGAKGEPQPRPGSSEAWRPGARAQGTQEAEHREQELQKEGLGAEDKDLGALGARPKAICQLGWDDRRQDSPEQEAERRPSPGPRSDILFPEGQGFAAAIVHEYMYLVKYKKAILTLQISPCMPYHPW